MLDVESLTEEQAKSILKKILQVLNELDQDDYFGSEGWKRYFGFEG